MHKIFPEKLSKEQCRDTGMALVLLFLIGYTLQRRDVWISAAILVHVVNMIAPQVYRPAAFVWFSFSNLLGTVMSTAILAALYFILVTPVSLLRRIAGKDTLQLRGFRAGADSVMLRRNHVFSGRDMERPY